MHAAHDDHVGVGARRFPSQLQRVADDVRDAVKDFRGLVIVREDHRAFLDLEPVDRVDVRSEKLPFGRG